MRIIAGLLAAIILIFLFMSKRHVDLSAYDSLQRIPGPIPDSALSVQFAGISTLLISDGTSNILTDGFFTRPSIFKILFGKIEPDTSDIRWALNRLGADKLDGVFVLHAHFDHAMDAPEVARLTNATLYGSSSTAQIGKGWGLSETQIQIYENKQAIQIGAFRITPILTEHYVFPNEALKKRALEGSQEITEPLVPPVGAFDYKMGGAYSLYIEHPKGNLLIHGSAGFSQDVFADIRPEVVFLGIGGLAKQTKSYQNQYFEELLDKTLVKHMYPIHYDAFAGSIRLPMLGPTYLNDIMMDAKGSLDLCMDASLQRKKVMIHLLPQWDKVNIFYYRDF